MQKNIGGEESGRVELSLLLRFNSVYYSKKQNNTNLEQNTDLNLTKKMKHL